MTAQVLFCLIPYNIITDKICMWWASPSFLSTSQPSPAACCCYSSASWSSWYKGPSDVWFTEMTQILANFCKLRELGEFPTFFQQAKKNTMLNQCQNQVLLNSKVLNIRQYMLLQQEISLEKVEGRRRKKLIKTNNIQLVWEKLVVPFNTWLIPHSNLEKLLIGKKNVIHSDWLVML